MSDIDRIKDRIRKLMAYANDGNASDAEIENAMTRAAELIDKHHIDATDVAPGVEAQPDKVEFGDAFATSQASKFSTWETTLANAVERLFGCVKWYLSEHKQPIRVNGIVQTDKAGSVRIGRRVCFYGPLTESAEAAGLFEEWARSVATMGVVRWGGCFRGDGAMYCYGFTVALLRQARKLDDGRQLKNAKAPAMLGDSSTAITLTKRYDLIKSGAESWLEDSKGIKLTSRSKSSGYSAGSGGAFAEGERHGSATSFARNARRKMLS